MQNFRDLQVWQKAHALTLSVYRSSERFSKEERYGLTSQLRRAAASIGTNIAEGCGRGTDPDFARFLQIAMGSASEVEYLLLLARDLSELADEEWQQLNELIAEVKRMLTAFIRTLKADG